MFRNVSWLEDAPGSLRAVGEKLHVIPFLGALCGVMVVFLVSVLTFDSLGYAVMPPLVFLAITSAEGNLITPHLLGRSMSLNPIVVFLSLTIWGWMWGIGGAFLAVPILAVLKVGFDQFERTRYLGVLLSDDQKSGDGS